MKQAHARPGRARGIGDRARLHGHVRLLRRAPTKARRCARSSARSSSAATSSTPPTCTGRTPTRSSSARAIAGRRERGRSWRPSSAIKLEPGDPPRAAPIDGSPAYVRAACEASLQRLRRRAHRPLLPAPRRPRHADRGDRRRDGRAGRAGQGPLPRPLRGGAGDDPPRARRAPDHRACRASTRCGRATSSRRSCRRSRAGHRAGRLLAARARLPVRPLQLARGARRGRLPPLRPALHRREPAAEPASSPSACKELAAEKGVTPGAARARVGAAPRRGHRADPRHQARVATWRRTSPPPRSSSATQEVQRDRRRDPPAAGERYDPEGMRSVNL